MWAIAVQLCRGLHFHLLKENLPVIWFSFPIPAVLLKSNVVDSGGLPMVVVDSPVFDWYEESFGGDADEFRSSSAPAVISLYIERCPYGGELRTIIE